MLKALIITVAYNPSTSVLDNLQVDYYPHLVVDNSEQETIWLKEYCLNNNHVYLWLGDNLGIARALNIGAEYAIEKGFDYIVTMDQDSKLQSNMLIDLEAIILNFGRTDNVAVFAPRHIINNQQLNSKSECTEDSIHTMTSGNFINLKIWFELNGFNTELFIDAVDIEYYVRAKLSNYRVLICNYVYLVHNMGRSTAIHRFWKYGFEVWNHPPIRKYYIARNYAYLVARYCKQVPELLYYKKNLLKMPMTILLFEDDKFRKLIYFFRGYLAFLRGDYGKYK
ncbi:MAG: glycosyltransferase [Neisseriales bacterium]|jgi:rhamnosyltransferase|nr:MAG: glycosyltransferase [Neisseriales bacterium]